KGRPFPFLCDRLLSAFSSVLPDSFHGKCSFLYPRKESPGEIFPSIFLTYPAGSRFPKPGARQVKKKFPYTGSKSAGKTGKPDPPAFDQNNSHNPKGPYGKLQPLSAWNLQELLQTSHQKSSETVPAVFPHPLPDN